ncbi:DEAD/DEAH box helicase [Longimicrobium sp.]|uniref:DEAD/DEAH box helicase n=1 Tax=Longimicrobium sp. TaxID=2029185 RepID=UPI002C74126C|nr:DEAD/DEAH box helicase [Longimicrobium sp.]HSU14700.1 DEAD/DEAH box helicase [Longimicrobium sp.]
MASFNDLGLREPLVMALEEEGIEHPTALQQAAIPVLRREGNLVARASSGSGKTLAYALGVLDRIEPRASSGGDGEGEGEEGDAGASGEGQGTRVLVLVPTAEAAEHAALSLVPIAHAADLVVTVSGPGWGTSAGEADVLVATPAQVMEAVRTSGVKLDAVEAIVIDGASDIEALGGWEPMETLFDNVPRTAQRVVITTTSTPAVQDLIDRRVKRSVKYPTQPAVPDAVEAATTGMVGYVPVSEREKVDTVARLLGGAGNGEAPPTLVCRTEERAAQVAEALSLRGFLVGDGDDEDADVVVTGSAEGLDGAGTVISFDVPGDEEALRARHGGEHTGFVLVQPRELPHLREIAKRAGFAASPAGITGEQHPAADELRRFRQEIRRAIREEDVGAQMLVLEPLFEDYTAAEVAAAAAALLRKRAPVPAAEPAPAAAPRASASSAGARLPLQRESTSGGAPAPFTRLFVGVGERDGIRAGDLVGAIAGEADIPGSSVGKIDIRDTFSIVEVPADAAQRVIDAVNGTTIKGRSVRVDYDRGGDRARRPGGGTGSTGPRGAGPRGGGFRGGGAREGGGPPSRGGPRGGGFGGGGGTRRPPVRRPPRDE